MEVPGTARTFPGIAVDRRVELRKNLPGNVLPSGDRPATGFQLVIAACGCEGPPIFAGKRGERFQFMKERHAAERAQFDDRRARPRELVAALLMIASTFVGAKNSVGDIVPAFMRAKPSIAR
jgi:hypothetical protein